MAATARTVLILAMRDAKMCEYYVSTAETAQEREAQSLDTHTECQVRERPSGARSCVRRLPAFSG